MSSRSSCSSTSAAVTSMSVIASHCSTIQRGSARVTRLTDLLAERARRWRRTAAPPTGRRRCPGLLGRPGELVDVVPALDAVGPAEHRAVGPPVAAEEQQHREEDRDDDALEHAEEHDTQRSRPATATATTIRGPAQYRRSAPRLISDNAAAITTAASADCGRSASKRVEEEQQDHDEPGADEAGELRSSRPTARRPRCASRSSRPRTPGRSRRRRWPRPCRSSPGWAAARRRAAPRSSTRWRWCR